MPRALLEVRRLNEDSTSEFFRLTAATTRALRKECVRKILRYLVGVIGATHFFVLSITMTSETTARHHQIGSCKQVP